MIDTRAVMISVTISYKHKYISNPTITSEDAVTVIVVAKKLTVVLKRKMPCYLQEYLLVELTRLLSRIFFDAV